MRRRGDALREEELCSVVLVVEFARDAGAVGSLGNRRKPLIYKGGSI